MAFVDNSDECEARTPLALLCLCHVLLADRVLRACGTCGPRALLWSVIVCWVSTVVLASHSGACFTWCLGLLPVAVLGSHGGACFTWRCLVCKVIHGSHGVTLLPLVVHLGTCLCVHGLWLVALCSSAAPAPL
jgi:hypothetical protein